ncbi:MAG TPA: pyridoxamine 5'-phosphate oxidase family protein [Actinomycetes bacterium]|nr:pyridoxamine 5'-phosphate oxidase family protein [Actinomycetes bacterium]
MLDRYEPTARTRLRRLPERGHHDRATIHAILDEGFICHVAFVVDGQPYALPTSYARVGDTLYLHGSSGSRLGLRPRMPVCVTVTLLDGVVLARSAFHHSYNYRSAMVLGTTRPVTDPAEKDAALGALVEHIVPGRREGVRGPDRKELAATAVLALPLDEVSAKVRSGPPGDEEEDYGLPWWSGILPLALVPGRPEPDPRLTPGIPVPAHVSGWRRPAPAKGGPPAPPAGG